MTNNSVSEAGIKINVFIKLLFSRLISCLYIAMVFLTVFVLVRVNSCIPLLVLGFSIYHCLLLRYWLGRPNVLRVEEPLNGS